MKTKLNLTIDNDILARIKTYADQKHTTISQLVEDYFKRIVKPAHKENIITLVEKLQKPTNIDANADLKELFYESHLNK